MMIRRRVVALISAALMLGIATVTIGAFIAATQSDGGREWIRRALEAQLARAVNGRVHLGTLSGTFLTDLRIDSVRIADRDDSVFVATGPVHVTFDPRDLADGRLIVRSAQLERPFIGMRRDTAGRWTSQKLWPRAGTLVPRRRTAFGAIFLVEQVQVRDGQFVLMMPDRGRDGAIETRVWRWQSIQADLPRVRVAYPDSVGTRFQIARLDVDVVNPPFDVTELTGEVTAVRDSVILDIARFALPGSVAQARGVIAHPPRSPIQLAIRIVSDSVSLNDVAWIDPAIPTSGGGRMVLDIGNAPTDPRAITYAISAMDVRAHRSRLRGRMTWEVGGEALALRNVDLEASPLDVALLERFNGGPFDVPLRGRFTGRLRASGGPLDRWVVDSVDARFADDNVDGATSRARASGELDIRDVGNTIFRGVDLTLTHFDLRTAQALDPDFPRLHGTLRGTARLDSSWLDVRLSDADVTHADGEAPTSRLRGSARIDWARGPVRYELDATALPISFTTLARSFTAFPLRGEYSGPVRASGELGDLILAGDLVGSAGRIEADLNIDAELPEYRVTGRSTLTAVDPRLLFGRNDLPEGELTARFVVNVRGDSLANLAGDATMAMDRSLIGGSRVFAAGTQLRFADGVAHADTLFLESSAVDVAGRGALGLHASRTDSLDFRVRVDSLGGLRSWLNRPVGDSLSGRAFVEGRARGWLRGFDVDVTATAGGLLFAGNTVEAVRGTAHLTGLPEQAAGAIAVAGDTLRVGRLGVASFGVDALRDGSPRTALQVTALGDAGTTLRAGGMVERNDSLRVRLDSLSLTTALHRWGLEGPSTLVVADGGFRVDTVELRAGSAGLIAMAGRLPVRGLADLRLNAREVPTADLAEILQLTSVDEGAFDLSAHLRGTRAAPELQTEGELRSALVRGIRFDTLRAVARAAADQLDVRVALGRSTMPSLTAEGSLPLHLGLDGSGMAMRPSGAVSARIRADSFDLGAIEALTRGVTGSTGTMAVAVDLSGTWGRPFVDGTVRVRNGVLAPPVLGAVRWRGVEADLLFVRDSIAVQRVVAQSGSDRRGRAEISGWVKLVETDDPRFDLRFVGRGFHAYAQPSVADLDISGDVRLSGSWRAAVLRGDLTADRAYITIPELTSKDVISLEDPDRFGAIDTTILIDIREAPVATSTLLENLTIANLPVRMGRDVWLRSSEANINLGGQVNITRGRIARGRNAGQLQLALDGPLQTVRGTYRLNLGPVQRTFEVEGGEIRFFGDAELNPTLDISALHTVRQYSAQGVRPDVRVRVHLGGTLLQPTAQLSTPDSVRVTNADLISYLVTGGPSFEIGGRNGDLSATALSVVLGSFGSVIGGKATGGLCDDANVSTAGLDQYGGPIRQVGAGVLSGIRFNCARQIGDNAFVRLDAGLCQVGQLMAQNTGSDPLSFTDALGVKLDYILAPGYSASIGVEPPTSGVLCSVNANASARGFVPTPRQVGFDVFRVWRF